MSTLLPLSDRVLVKRVEAEKKSPGGIIIPDAAKEKPTEGIVVAVGPGRILDNGKRLEPQVKKGDRVLFGKYSGTEAKALGDDHVIIREDDILCIKDEPESSFQS